MANLLNPEIKNKKVANDDRFQHDKLDISDIAGTKGDVYRKYRNIEGRDYMQVNDIDKTKPAQLKQNRITNIPDYKIDTRDIDSPKLTKFKTLRNTDPLNP